MGRKKVQRSTAYKVYHFEGVHWTPIHSDDSHTWIIPFNIKKKIVGGVSKKVDKSFLDSLEFVILAK